MNGSAGDRRRFFMPLVVALGVFVPAALIVTGVLLTSGGGSTQPAAARFTPVAQVTTSTAASTLTATPRHVSVIPGGHGAIVAAVVKPTAMRSAAAGGQLLARIGLRTQFGSPQVMLVARTNGSWLGVVSPLAGNGRLGWIPASATKLSRISFEIKVSLSARRLEVLDSGRVLQRYTVAVGRPTAPTPTGRFAVTDRLATGNPAGPYGCCILALSAVSPHAIQGWTGGNRIAIHSTPDTSSIGQPVSHGCMRLTLAEGRWLMTHIPLGTPTVITT